MDIEQIIRQYLPDIIHLSLATCSGDQPWVAEVHYAYDDQLNLYFRSLSTRRHSQEIAANPKVAGNIVTQHSVNDQPQGIYFEGRAAQLASLDENHPAYTAYCDRFGTGTSILDEARSAEGHQFYQITVDTFYLFDARHSDPGRKYELPWMKGR